MVDKIKDLREKILPVLLPCGANRVALFGSVARGEDRPDSDVDVLVSFREPLGLFRLAHLQHELETALARQVDLVTEGALSRYLRPYVEKEQVILYEE